MIIDFTKVLLDQDNNQISDPTISGKDLTLGRAASYALNASFQDEQQLSGEEKFKRGMLAFQIRDDDKADLKAEDVVLIKKVIGKAYSPLIVYRIYQMLDS